jgi:hypothetical protein
MAKESKFGSVTHLSKGQVVQTADGKSITTMGNEVARLSSLLNKGHSNEVQSDDHHWPWV